MNVLWHKKRVPKNLSWKNETNGFEFKEDQLSLLYRRARGARSCVCVCVREREKKREREKVCIEYFGQN